jgi:hypothetical protein
MLAFTQKNDYAADVAIEIIEPVFTSSYASDCSIGRAYAESAREHLNESGNVPAFVSLLAEVAALPPGNGFKVGFLTDIAVELSR